MPLETGGRVFVLAADGVREVNMPGAGVQIIDVKSPAPDEMPLQGPDKPGGDDHDPGLATLGVPGCDGIVGQIDILDSQRGTFIHPQA